MQGNILGPCELMLGLNPQLWLRNVQQVVCMGWLEALHPLSRQISAAHALTLLSWVCRVCCQWHRLF